MKYILEYVWIDGHDNLRSKIKVIDSNNIMTIERCPIWNFDGSSTNQSEGHFSDVILKPVRLYNNPFFDDKLVNSKSYLVLCECYTTDMKPHVTNLRAKCVETNTLMIEHECLFGIEQEYVIFERNGKPYKWLSNENPSIGEQGPYYCSIGGDRNFGREISNTHLMYCLQSGVHICGTNSEVMASQWEFQIGTCDPVTVSDDLYMARYILQRITEKYKCYISYHPKPHYENWNGSGGHTNFSTKQMREVNGIEHIYEACEKLKEKHLEHIKVYGKDNDKRLSGKYETSDISNFSYGVANRGASIRIPLQVSIDGHGYLEDRRPSANLNPYLVTEKIMNTVCNN